MAPVTSGVPQGSLLGLLMFVLFINDLPDASYGDVNIALYAGDSKIKSAVKCVYDCEVVQTTLSNMDEWTQYDKFQFNTSKCKVLTVICKKQPVHCNQTLKDMQLTCVADKNDFGIIFTSTLWLVKHINAILSKVNKILGPLKCTCPLLLDVAVSRNFALERKCGLQVVVIYYGVALEKKRP